MDKSSLAASGAAGATVVVAATFVRAATSSIPPITAPESFWPTTVTGWMTAFLSLCSIIGVIYALHRFSLRPIEQKVQDMLAGFSKELNNFSKTTDERLNSFSKSTDERLNGFTQAVELRLNGFGSRMNEMSTESRITEEATQKLLIATAASERDSKHMQESVQELKRLLSARSEYEQQILRVLQAINSQRNNRDQ